MSFEVQTTPRFERQAKILSKRYRSFKNDLKILFRELSVNPMQGAGLSTGIRKIRFSIASKGRGKSGGARVITYTVQASDNGGKVYLIELYDKSDYSSVNVNTLKKIISDLDL